MSTSGDPLPIRRLAHPTESEIAALAAVLIDCVEGGASVSFMHPVMPAKAAAFWRQVGAEAAAGRRVLLAAFDGEGIVGTVQMIPSASENQPHRADIAKMLVHRRGRGRGVGSALLGRAEACARAAGRTLLVLDTATGSDAERLYARLGWQLAGVVPGYALWPRGGLCATSFYYRKLD